MTYQNLLTILNYIDENNIKLTKQERKDLLSIEELTLEKFKVIYYSYLHKELKISLKKLSSLEKLNYKELLVFANTKFNEEEINLIKKQPDLLFVAKALFLNLSPQTINLLFPKETKYYIIETLEEIKKYPNEKERIALLLNKMSSPYSVEAIKSILKSVPTDKRIISLIENEKDERMLYTACKAFHDEKVWRSTNKANRILNQKNMRNATIMCYACQNDAFHKEVLDLIEKEEDPIKKENIRNASKINSIRKNKILLKKIASLNKETQQQIIETIIKNEQLIEVTKIKEKENQKKKELETFKQEHEIPESIQNFKEKGNKESVKKLIKSLNNAIISKENARKYNI